MDKYLGKMLDNRYEMLELTGVGGMAKVYKAKCHRLNRMVAVKILRDEMAEDADIRRRFFEESQAVAMLQHPNIVQVYDVSHTEGLYYIVMELIEGITLKQYMDKKGGKLNPKEVAHFMPQIISALGHAHSKGIIHRDIKPQNIMVLRNGSVKVTDFGIAQLAFASEKTMKSEALGSVHYIAPEQARGSHIDARADLYSAGVVMYQMLTGRLPFEGDSAVAVAIQHINSIPLSPREINPDIPEWLEAITMKAMEPNLSKRFANAKEMLDAFETYQKSGVVFIPNNDRKEDITTSVAAGVTSAMNDPASKDFVRVDRPRKHGKSSTQTTGSQKNNRKQDYYQEEEKSKAPIIIAIVAVILMIIGIIFFLVTSVFGGSSNGKVQYANVPNLLGKLYEDVITDTQLLNGFTITIGAEDSQSGKPEGTILRQTPDGGTKVSNDGNKVITVTIASASDAIFITDMANMEYRQAKIMLENNGLVVAEPVYEFSEKIDSGKVIRSNPEPGTLMEPGDAVVLFVSKGKEVADDIKLENYVNQTQQTAENGITASGLKIGSISREYSDDIMEGCVISQFPAGGTMVPAGSSVDLIISRGKDPATSSSEEEKPSDSSSENEQPSESSSEDEVKYKDILVNLPMKDGSVDIRVTIDNELVASAYDVTCSENSSLTYSFTVPYTASGSKLLEVYYDGESEPSFSSFINFD